MSEFYMDKPYLYFMYGYLAMGKTTRVNEICKQLLKSGYDVELIIADKVLE